jgi:Ca-activated chloride channel family protein
VYGGGVRFVWPLALAGVALVPLAAAAYVLVERRRARFAIRFTNVDVLASVVPERPPRRGLVPPALFGLALIVAIVAVARPQTAQSVNRKQATVVLVIDTSGSMVANDVQPSRLAAAQEAVRRFVDQLPGRFEVGMVTFSTEARVAMPITDDHELASQGLEHLNAFGGTAIGDAIARAIDLLRHAGKGAAGTSQAGAAGKVPPSAIVLLSDGAQNRGQLQPRQAALRAKHFKIPVYTVALGTPGGSIKIGDGAFSETITVPPDPQTLKQIALETGGRFYAAGSGARLNAVYDTLASRLSARRVYREATSLLLGVSAVLLLSAGVLSAFWLPRLP